MQPVPPRAIAVVDAGATNSKVLLFDRHGGFVTERRTPSAHKPAPPYAAIDPEPLVAWLPGVLTELDQILPIDAVVTSAHGSGLACLDAAGDLALPIMDYTAEPPRDIVAAYRPLAPAFDEAFAPLAPMALTIALQLFWQEQALPEKFRRVATLLPWAQYVGYRLSGVAVSEVTTLGAQSQLWDVPQNRYSSIVRSRAWDRLFAPLRQAWDVIGPLRSMFRGPHFRGRGDVLAGVHDSNANYLRMLAAGLDDFSLLSTGTWIIGFAPGASIRALDPARDTVTNTDVFGRSVACCRFMGGREFEVVSGGAPASAAAPGLVLDLMKRGTFALPSFTTSGGPMPGTGGRGRIVGPPPASEAERASLASLYCGLMSVQSLAAVGATGDIVIDGPFAHNPIYLSVIAALRPGQAVLTSDLKEGTAAGAALLGLMTGSGKVPRVPTTLARPALPELPGLDAYAARWLSLSEKSRLS